MAKVRASKRGKPFQMVQFRLTPTQFAKLRILVAELGISIQAFMVALVSVELKGMGGDDE